MSLLRKNHIQRKHSICLNQSLPIEKLNRMASQNSFNVNGEDLLRKIKELIHEGNVNRIVIKNEAGKTYLEIPVAIGVIGTVLAPVFAAVGALAALAARFSIEVTRVEDKE